MNDLVIPGLSVLVPEYLESLSINSSLKPRFSSCLKLVIWYFVNILQIDSYQTFFAQATSVPSNLPSVIGTIFTSRV